MAEIPFGPVQDRTTPQHSWFASHGTDAPDEELYQYRAKVQRYSRMPSEITVQRVSFDRDMQSYRRAYENGLSDTRRRGYPREKPEFQDPEDAERSMRRAKTKVRKLVTELAPSALVTFTTRKTITLEDLLWSWRYFCRLMKTAGFDFDYVAVPERHPKNPEHLHVHAAYRGRVNIATMRRFWHMALEAREGRKVSVTLRGAESPGNIDVQSIKARDQLRRVRKVARYVSKYITKDLIAEFNRKRYWPSKGILLADSEAFWLDAKTVDNAILEACGMFGLLEAEGVPAQTWFRPCERVAWLAIDPGQVPDPPF